MSLKLHTGLKDQDMTTVLQDLVVRFVINCPEQDLSSSERLFFQLEEAQWFYEDFCRVESPSLPSMKMKTFVERMFQCCPVLYLYSQDMLTDLSKFQSYKSLIPVRGAIILNKKMTKALMVKGWRSDSPWGFPKGKINKDEQDDLCAVREVYEEIGYDISPFLYPDDYVEVTIQQKNIRLYIVRGIPGNTHFAPRTRKEISKIEWHDVKSLPAYSKNRSNTPSNNSYYMVAPFMSGLAKYISKARGLASSLTKSETKALKNLLGVGSNGAVGGEVGQVADVIQPNSGKQSIEEDNDQAARHLLDLLKIGPGASKGTDSPTQSIVSDRKILLNLVNQGHNNELSNEEYQLESAKEILSLLRNELDQQQPVLPALVQPPPMFGGLLPPTPNGPPLPFQNNQFYPPMPPMPPNSVPPVIYPFGYIPGQGQQQLQAQPQAQPKPQPQTPSQPQPQSEAASTKPDYSPPAPPPVPPHMSSLLSLLNSRKSGHKSTPSIENEANIKDRRFDSMSRDSKPLKLSDLAEETGSGSFSLLSLLNKEPKKQQQQQEQQQQQQQELKPGDSLMDLLQPKSSLSSVFNNNNLDNFSTTTTNGSNSATSLMGFLNQSNQPAIQPAIIKDSKDASLDLMEMLNPGRSSRSSPQINNSNTYGNESLQPDASTSLMNLLGVKPTPSPNNIEDSSIIGLGPAVTTPIPSIASIPPTAPEVPSIISQPPISPPSTSTSLMDLLKPNKSPLPSDIKTEEINEDASSRSLMDLLGAGLKSSPAPAPAPAPESAPVPQSQSQSQPQPQSPTSPAPGPPPTQSTPTLPPPIGAPGSRQPSFGAVGESRISHPANRQSSSGQNLLNLLNLGKQSPGPEQRPSSTDNSDGGQSLMTLLNKTSAPEPPVNNNDKGKSLMELLQGNPTTPSPITTTTAIPTAPIPQSVDSEKFVSFLKEFASGSYA